MTRGLTNPDLTSDRGLARRVHFCVSAHRNSNDKRVWFGRGFGLGKFVFRKVWGERVVWFSVVFVCVCVCVCVSVLCLLCVCVWGLCCA